MMDFTFKKYENLLNSLLTQGFSFYTLLEYFTAKNLSTPFVILRHDVEARYENALQFAEIQHQSGIRGSYYFRLLPKSYKETIINEIADLGHEIGYHYDDLSFCKGDHKAAIQRFEKHLDLLREVSPVQTITMEGAPLSKYDNKDLWKYYDYRTLSILGEPYFDIDFDKMFYLTDTGRRWDGWRVSVRDKVPQQDRWTEEGLVFHSTDDIIRAANAGRLPNKIMMTFHPQRWTDKPLPWIKELLWQGVKNVGKRVLIRLKNG